MIFYRTKKTETMKSSINLSLLYIITKHVIKNGNPLTPNHLPTPGRTYEPRFDGSRNIRLAYPIKCANLCNPVNMLAPAATLSILLPYCTAAFCYNEIFA